MLFSCQTSAIPSSDTLIHNITRFLAKYLQFSAFNHHLSTTSLALEIDFCYSLTICLGDTPTMHHFLTKWAPTTIALQQVLNLHVFGYYEKRNLHHLLGGSALTMSLFFKSVECNHVSRSLPSYINITDLKGGKVVRFSTKEDIDGGMTAYLVRYVKVRPNDFALIQISGFLLSPLGQPNGHHILTNIMSASGCALYAKTLMGTEAGEGYKASLDDWLTMFCP